MRDIKFRAYNPRDKKMHCDITGFEFFGDGNMSGVFIDGIFFLIEEVELMQYTGLKDKNGKEIYEGDIILIDKENQIKGQVKYSEKYAGFIITNTNSIADEAENLSDYIEVEILGNIYDNPDLLEKGAE